MNTLKNTKTYLVGHMQYIDGTGWRQKVKSELEPRHIKCFDPYEKPFVKDLDEGKEIRDRLALQLKSGDYNSVEEHMKEIRIYDLNLVDRSDFIIAHIVPNVASWGSAEELVTSTRMKKPTFISIEGGKSACPLWLFGMFPHEYIYNSIDDIIRDIKLIDDGTITIDPRRWRLLKPEHR